jgi:hypothetical protein
VPGCLQVMLAIPYDPARRVAVPLPGGGSSTIGPMGDARTFVSTQVGLSLLAEVVGLDLWDFLDQVGGSIPGTRLVSSPSDADAAAPGLGRGQPPPRPGRRASDVVAAQVAAEAGNLSELAECDDQLALLQAFAAVMLPGAIETAAAPYLAAAVESLLPAADALAQAPAAQWWWEPPDSGSQRWLGGAGQQSARGAALTAALQAQGDADAEEESRTAREWPWTPNQDAVYSGTWWSPPLGSGVFTSTGPVGPLPAAEAGCELDGAGEERFELWDVGISSGARIWNITSPDDWGRLVARYPRDVTASRRHDWFRFTGRDGTWLLPDWPRAASDWDGVHLSIAGYISATGLAIPAGDAATVLAGWGPDQTLWLNDVFTSVNWAGTWTGTPGPEAFPEAPLPWLGPR